MSDVEDEEEFDLAEPVFGPSHGRQFAEAARQLKAQCPKASLARCEYVLDLVLQADFPKDGVWGAALDYAAHALVD